MIIKIHNDCLIYLFIKSYAIFQTIFTNYFYCIAYISNYAAICINFKVFLSEQNIPLDTIIHSDNWIKEIEKFGVQPNKIALLNTSKSLINNPDSAITLLCQIFGTSEVQSFKMNSKGSNVREILEMHDMVYENDEYNIDTVINIGQGLKLYVNSIPRSKHSLTAKISIKCFPESIYYINFVCYIKTADDIEDYL